MKNKSKIKFIILTLTLMLFVSDLLAANPYEFCLLELPHDPPVAGHVVYSSQITWTAAETYSYYTSNSFTPAAYQIDDAIIAHCAASGYWDHKTLAPYSLYVFSENYSPSLGAIFKCKKCVGNPPVAPLRK